MIAVDVGDAQVVKAQMRFIVLMKNCCHRRDGWNGNSTVNFCLVLRRRSNSGCSADVIGMENARSSPPLSAGNVIMFSLKSMQFIGSRVSRYRQPVCREMSKTFILKHFPSQIGCSSVLASGWQKIRPALPFKVSICFPRINH